MTSKASKNRLLGADFKGYRLHYAYVGVKLILAVLSGNRDEAEVWYETWMI